MYAGHHGRAPARNFARSGKEMCKSLVNIYLEVKPFFGMVGFSLRPYLVQIMHIDGSQFIQVMFNHLNWQI